MVFIQYQIDLISTPGYLINVPHNYHHVLITFCVRIMDFVKVLKKSTF